MSYHIDFTLKFRQNPYSVPYIAFEGVDGSGKTTQIELLKQYFIKQKKLVETTSEPRVSLPGGELIMDVFLKKVSMSGVAFQHILTANRLMNHEQIVEPALKRGEVVLSDRCFWSALPYGMLDQGVDFSKSEADLLLVSQSILSHYHQVIVPDRVFFIDINTKEALKRIQERGGRKDIYEKEEKLKKIIAGYRFLTKTYSGIFTIIDGMQSVEKVHAEVVKFYES